MAREIKAVQQTLLKQLVKSGEGTIVLLDLGPALLRASEVAALLGDLVHGIAKGEYPGRYLVSRDNEGQNIWDADAALKKESDLRGQGLAVVWRSSTDACTLIGRVDPLIGDTYAFVSAAASPDEATARQLARNRRVSVQAASNRLTRVARLGLIHTCDRVPAAGGGSQFTYVAVA